MGRAKNKECICKFCNTKFFAVYKKASICSNCKTGFKCKICNNIITPGSRYCNKHHNILKKGKTYKEIYGTDNPKCGFKKGENNIAKQKHIREKISKGVRKSYVPELLEKRRRQFKKKRPNTFKFKYITKRGEKCRSKYELIFANYLYENNIEYQTEVPIRMKNGKLKIVDFIINNNIIIEITGYGYDNWIKSFNEKIKILRESVNNPLIIITTKYKDEELWKNCSNYNIFIHNIDDLDYIKETIRLSEYINILNKVLFKQEVDIHV